VDVQDAAESSPVVARLHPDAVRRRRVREGLAGAAVAVIIALVAGWALTQHEEPSSFGHLTWRTPEGWSVVPAETGGCHIYPGLLLGPFIGTVATGSMYRPTSSGWECGRHLAVSRKPADGVVGWVDTESVPLDRAPAPDPGAMVAGICGGAAGGQVFHSFRVLTGLTERLRVTLDGCAFGPKAGTYLQQLRAVSAGLRYE
jgi:hypothetical protein